MEITVLWEGPGNMSVELLDFAPCERVLTATIRQQGMAQKIKLVVAPPNSVVQQVLASASAPAQIKKIRKNPEAWAYRIVSQRVRTARAGIVRCRRKLAGAEHEGDRWAALAGHLGINF